LTVGPADDDFYLRVGGFRVLPSLAQTRDFIVDSGSWQTVISYKLAQRLELEAPPELVTVFLYGGQQGRFYQSRVRLFLNSWLTVPCLIPERQTSTEIPENVLGMKGILRKFSLTLSDRGLLVSCLCNRPLGV
jgi:hypothetical protein